MNDVIEQGVDKYVLQLSNIEEIPLQKYSVQMLLVLPVNVGTQPCRRYDEIKEVETSQSILLPATFLAVDNRHSSHHTTS